MGKITAIKLPNGETEKITPGAFTLITSGVKSSYSVDEEVISFSQYDEFYLEMLISNAVSTSNLYIPRGVFALGQRYRLKFENDYVEITFFRSSIGIYSIRITCSPSGTYGDLGYKIYGR